MAPNARLTPKPHRKRKAPVIVVAIVTRGEQILMIERRDVPGTRSGYVFPGGKVECDESLEQAVVREVWEETGIHCRAEREIASRIHPTSAARIHYWLCPFVSAKRQQPEFPLVWARVEHLESMAGATLFPLVKRELERSTGDQLSRTTFSTASP